MKQKADNQTPRQETRPPVVAVMGHIDHGKSTLLDFIRKTNVVASEAGGITQRIAGYEVVHTVRDTGAKKRITFIDTPGHAAFKGMRSRGASVADVAILVVSAEEGVKPQTLEALEAIKTSKAPYIVAINKIDSPKADIERTKQSLAEHEIYVEGYGGDIPWVAVSAKTGQGVEDLLDLILLVAELGDLRAHPDAPARGIIIEAHRDAKKGISATLIIQNGTLHQGDYVVSGEVTAPVRLLLDWNGSSLTSATFSSPVALIGWSGLPTVGDAFEVVANKRDAEAAVEAHKEQRANTAKKQSAPSPSPANADTSALTENADVMLPFIIKADAAGSLEAIVHEITLVQKRLDTATSQKGSAGAVKIRIVQSGLGPVNEGDVKFALGAHAIVLGFTVKTDTSAAHFAERNAIVIHQFDIIYKLIEWIENYATERIPKVTVEERTGFAKILKVFSKVKDRQIVGGKVQEGEIALGAEVKILRRDAEIGRGRIRELQQQKEKASSVATGAEFGMMIEAKTEIAPGDKIEAFTLITK
jgi:translation initiation factor IF-2